MRARTYANSPSRANHSLYFAWQININEDYRVTAVHPLENNRLQPIPRSVSLCHSISHTLTNTYKIHAQIHAHSCLWLSNLYKIYFSSFLSPHLFFLIPLTLSLQDRHTPWINSFIWESHRQCLCSYRDMLSVWNKGHRLCRGYLRNISGSPHPVSGQTDFKFFPIYPSNCSFYTFVWLRALCLSFFKGSHAVICENIEKIMSRLFRALREGDWAGDTRTSFHPSIHQLGNISAVDTRVLSHHSYPADSLSP